MADILKNLQTQINIGKGFIRLVDCMPRLSSPDIAIVEAARVSYAGQNIKTKSEDKNLLRYLMRHQHMTPFEMVEFKFHCKMPKFVAAQWVRHRTASINEYSARYSTVEDVFYCPELAQQSVDNKQGSGDKLEDQTLADEMDKHYNASYQLYTKLLAAGVSREQARCVLPQAVYTEWYWKCDLRNIFGFLKLRMDKHAQFEIREYAYAMFDLIKNVCPIASEAFLDYNMYAVTLTVSDISEYKNPGHIKNKREKAEYEEKIAKLKDNSN